MTLLLPPTDEERKAYQTNIFAAIDAYMRRVGCGVTTAIFALMPRAPREPELCPYCERPMPREEAP